MVVSSPPARGRGSRGARAWRGPPTTAPGSDEPGWCNAADDRRLPSALDGDAHRAGGAGDDALGLVQRVGVEVGHLGLRDLTDLVAGDGGDLGLVRLAGALLDAGGLEQHARGRRGLGDEGERAVLEHRDLDGHDVTALRLGRRVVRLAELHDVDAVLAERRTDGRRGGGSAGLDLELDDRGQPLPGGHDFLLRDGMERPRRRVPPRVYERWGARRSFVRSWRPA